MLWRPSEREQIRMISKNIGLELPDYLDPEEFDLAWGDVRQRIGFNEGAFRLFHMAWHGVANRALAVDYYLAQARSLPPLTCVPNL